MKILETEYEKKSFAITVTLFILLFLFLLLIKLSIEPLSEELEGGGGGGEIAINFGNSDVGSGDNYKSKDLSVPVVKAIPVKTVNKVEKVLTQETKDAPVISQTKTTEKIITPKPVVKEAPKPSKSTTDALSSLLNGSNKSGDGTDKTGGNKGKSNGDPNAKGYDGNGKNDVNGLSKGDKYGNSTYGDGTGIGIGKGNSWGLKGRKLTTASQKVQDCNEYGIVVVKIYVNKQGNVIRAERVQGTTNTDPCLVNPAIATAKSFKWQADNNAPETQIGFIVVNFKVGE